MRVIIDDRVHDVIENFYKVSLRLHPTLGEVTVENKKDRLYAALGTLQEFPFRNAEARHKQEWKRRRYLVLICEDFLFGYKVYKGQSHLLFCIGSSILEYKSFNKFISYSLFFKLFSRHFSNDAFK